MPVAFAMRRAKSNYPLVQPTDLVAAFVDEDLVLTFTPDGAAVADQYRYRTPAGVWSRWVTLPDAEESFSPNTSYVFQVRGVDANGKVGPPSNGSIASFTVAIEAELIGSFHTSTTDAATFSFTSGDFGEVDDQTYAFVIVTHRDATARTLDSSTIGGLTPIVVADNVVTLTTVHSRIVKLTTPGTQAMVFNFSGNYQRIVAQVFKIHFLTNTTPVMAADGSMTSGALSASVAALAGGVVIASAQNGAAGAFTWTGDLTEVGADVAPENLQVSGALALIAADSTPTATATAAGPPSSINTRLTLWAFR